MKKQLGRYTIEDVKVIASPFWDTNDDGEDIITDEDEIVDGILIIDTDYEFRDQDEILYGYSVCDFETEEELESHMEEHPEDFSTFDHVLYKDENDKEGIYLGC